MAILIVFCNSSGNQLTSVTMTRKMSHVLNSPKMAIFPQTSEELKMQLSNKMRAHFKCSDTTNTTSEFIDTPFPMSALVYKHHLLKHTVQAVQERF